MRELVYGVGVNDADYVVCPSINGNQTMCPFYRKWKAMLERCYSEKILIKHPTYAGCYVCDEWLTFSNFKSWMEKHDWQGKHLDKDIMGNGSIYSPENCCFVSPELNNFLTDAGARRGMLMIGVTLHKRNGTYDSMIRNPFTKKLEHLGSHSSEISAHNAWLNRKHELACMLADLQNDSRIASALRNKFSGRIRKGGAE